jgi:hypothetical protein
MASLAEGPQAKKKFTDLILGIEKEIPMHKCLFLSVLAKKFKLPHYDQDLFDNDSLKAFYSPIVSSILVDPLNQEQTKFFLSIYNVSFRISL